MRKRKRRRKRVAEVAQAQLRSAAGRELERATALACPCRTATGAPELLCLISISRSLPVPPCHSDSVCCEALDMALITASLAAQRPSRLSAGLAAARQCSLTGT